MKARISALMDGELDDRGFLQAYDALGRDGEALDAWRAYHLVSDAMRDTRMLSPGFASRVAERLANEPTVIAPGRLSEPRRWFAVSAAASVAAVGLVGWLAFGPQEPGILNAPVAKAPEVAPVKAAAAVKPGNPALIPPPVSANDYLLAHQGFSPRVWLQGMAPYVRTVSEPTPGARK